MGAFRGTLGTAIGYRWRGRWCMRSKPGQVFNPRTAEQTAHRNLFKYMVQFAARQGEATHVGLRASSWQLGMTESNRFVQLNCQCFSWQQGEISVDYPALCFSEGPVATAAFGQPALDSAMTLRVDFARDAQAGGHAESSDHVMLYALCPDVDPCGLLSLPVYRRNKRISMALPDEWAGRDIHLYGWASDRDGRVSASVYIGSVNSHLGAAPAAAPSTTSATRQPAVADAAAQRVAAAGPSAPLPEEAAADGDQAAPRATAHHSTKSEPPTDGQITMDFG